MHLPTRSGQRGPRSSGPAQIWSAWCVRGPVIAQEARISRASSRRLPRAWAGRDGRLRSDFSRSCSSERRSSSRANASRPRRNDPAVPRSSPTRCVDSMLPSSPTPASRCRWRPRRRSPSVYAEPPSTGCCPMTVLSRACGRSVRRPRSRRSGGSLPTADRRYDYQRPVARMRSMSPISAAGSGSLRRLSKPDPTDRCTSMSGACPARPHRWWGVTTQPRCRVQPEVSEP